MNRRQFIAVTSAATAVAGRARSESAAAAPLVSFGLVTDVQYADADPEGERHYRASVPKLKAAVEDLAKEKLPFTLHLGDMIDLEFASFAAIIPLLDPLGHPVRHLLGNHDYSVGDGMKTRVPATLGMAHDYYMFRSSGVCFIMLDTNDVSSYKHAEGSEADLEAEAMMKKQAAKAQPWTGGLSPAQLEWLEKQLDAADLAEESVIVCGHHPILPANGHEAWNSVGLPAVFQRHPCVRAYLCGHNHAGAELVQNGIPYITFKSLLHQPEVTAYSVVRLFKDRLRIEGRGREKSREIRF